jgi:membrane protease subunit HflK
MAWNEPGGNGNNQDPWGGQNDRDKGNRGNNEQGPPDLDEALRKLQDKMNELFGSGKKKSGGSGGASSGSTGGGSMLIVAAVVAVIVWAGMGFYTVDQQERGVVLRLGKYHDVVQPGLHWNPPLVDEVSLINTTRVREHDHKALMLTEDENIVDVSMVTQYVVSDPKAYKLQVRDPDGSLAQAAESALRQVVGSSDMHSILTEGRENLGIEVQSRLQRYMDDYKTGLSINKVNIKDAQAPAQVQDAFDDVIKAREDEQRVKNEAQSYSNGIIPEARGRAQRIIEEANAYRDQVVSRAEGDSKRFISLLGEYEKAPAVTRERLYIDAMQNVLQNNPKVLMDVDNGNNVMYLPMDKLMQSASERKQTSSSTSIRLDEQSMKSVSDQVADELRQRQTSVRREGRQ